MHVKGITENIWGDDTGSNSFFNLAVTVSFTYEKRQRGSGEPQPCFSIPFVLIVSVYSVLQYV